MNGSRAAGSIPRPPAWEQITRGLLICLPLAGLVSGIVCTAIVPFRVSGFLYGLIFAALIGGCLRKARLFSNQAWAWFALASEAATCVSAYGGGIAVMLLSIPFRRWLATPYPDLDSPVVFFAGGAIGAAVILAGVIWPVSRALGCQLSTAPKIIGGVICGGVLGALGWLLMDPLGTPVWRLLNLITLGEVLPYPSGSGLFGPTNLIYYSTFIVWQTGMGLVLALLLGGRKRTSLRKESDR